MKKRTRKTGDEPVGKLRVIQDFLPPPERLVPVAENMKITISLDANTIRFFKATANKLGLKYQRMMREVLSGYAKKYA